MAEGKQSEKSLIFLWKWIQYHKFSHWVSFHGQAHAALEEMRGRLPGVQLAFYVNMKTIEAVHRALDLPISNKATDNRLNGFSRGGGEEEEEEGEFVEEEVIDEMFPHGDHVWQADVRRVWQGQGSCIVIQMFSMALID